ncbi:hypothetical protein Cgig2_001714 [Carnegiea gigantea]|uniref:Uncharacterized protein n=1 Tax=Carnegiea gigantea TaxID=171969 RepID=A0A9Q1Q7E5_9CARY|nr:hypothetical protein Cgig2_001714 [Carnegiea gigantea]
MDFHAWSDAIVVLNKIGSTEHISLTSVIKHGSTLKVEITSSMEFEEASLEEVWGINNFRRAFFPHVITIYRSQSMRIGGLQVHKISDLEGREEEGRHNHNDIQVGLDLASLFSPCMTFNLLFIYVVKTFPTCIRTYAATLNREAQLLPLVFIMILVVVAIRNRVMYHTVFGGGIFVSGLQILCLLETEGKVFCDTVEEQKL